MSELFDPARHLPLPAPAWDEGQARSVIAGIAADTITAFDPQTLWKTHPKDAPVPDGAGGVYLGAAGNVWALDHLAREGAIQMRYDFRPALPRIVEADQAWLGSGPLGAYASLLIGDLGCLLAAMRLDPSQERAGEICGRLADNEALPVQDLMWGLSGSMLAALWMHNATGDPRFAETYRRQAAYQLSCLAELRGLKLWPFDLFGGPNYYTGLVHGFAGNVLALFKGWALLSPAQQATAQAAALAMLTHSAVQEGGLANWPSDLGKPEAPMLCQICHGAPGVIAAFAAAPFSSPQFEALLAAGGQTVWAAGALAKGSNVCHGTSGNGLALLTLYARTGEAVWLERARAMAMAAIGQYRADKAEYGVGRHSLWTGDTGLAVALWSCITTKPRFPSLDCF